MFRDVVELLFPRSCIGCNQPGCTLCESCQQQWRAIPQQISVAVDPEVPIWSLGVLGGVRRQAIIAMKERGRHDGCAYISPVLFAAVRYLQARGELDEPITLVPAPSTARAIRQRGLFLVREICRGTGLPTVDALRMANDTVDAVGLTAAQRLATRTRALSVRKRPSGAVVIVDDVITTGATITAGVRALTSAGVHVRGVVGLSHA